MGTWRARVDAATGEVLELSDINDYAAAQVTGGTYLNSPTTGSEVVRPAPFANVSTGGFTNSAGIYNWTSGTVTSTLAGQYVQITDSCGAISQASGRLRQHRLRHLHRHRLHDAGRTAARATPTPPASSSTRSTGSRKWSAAGCPATPGSTSS